MGGRDRLVPSPLALDAARERSLAPSALRRARADFPVQVVYLEHPVSPDQAVSLG